MGLWKYTSVNHPGHHNSCHTAFFYYPLGTFQMDVSPSFIQFLKFWSLWVKPHEDACSPSFMSKVTKKKKKGRSGLLPSFIVPWSHLLSKTGPAPQRRAPSCHAGLAVASGERTCSGFPFLSARRAFRA